MIRAILIFLTLTLSAHIATVWYLPRLAMNTAMSRLENLGGPANQLIHVPRTDETSRRVVRPSPDLLYSVCVLDLGAGPVRIRAADWGGYMSLSLFADNTDNVFSLNDTQSEGDIELVVAADGSADIELGSTRGLAIIRRLVTGDAMYERAQSIRAENDVCEQLVP